MDLTRAVGLGFVPGQPRLVRAHEHRGDLLADQLVALEERVDQRVDEGAVLLDDAATFVKPCRAEKAGDI